jgi:hypothetical protein
MTTQLVDLIDEHNYQKIATTQNSFGNGTTMT